MVILFSSDYYPVFKRDAFAVASLPHGYCYHFRYKSKYVSTKIKEALRESTSNYSETPAMIVFAAGNKKDNSNLDYIPIRLAKILCIEHLEHTDLYHAYFTLGDFISLKTEISTLDEKPQEIYLCHQVITPQYSIISWSTVARKLNRYGNGLLFNISINNHDAKALKPTIDSTRRGSYFELLEGTHYELKVSFADSSPKKEDNQIKAKLEATDIKSNIGTISPGLDLDDRSFRLEGLIVGDIKSSLNMLSISTENLQKSTPSNDYEVKLRFQVEKDWARLWWYFGFSLLVFLGGGLIAAASTNFLKAVGIVVASFGAAQLFFNFNKK